ncbi:MAG: hypothetical protein OEV00_08310 [Acidobacteriota bacterium]|nr:hypothetical protein [Acidobacteriota bacterium]MDH3785313.1 hypothetical protein [Acidobacteriota bacterium]
MVSIASLWLPILVSAVAVFIASSVIHMLIPWHRNDYSKLPGEDGIRAVMQQAKVPAGEYMVPHCDDMKAMGSDEMKKKYDEGPVGFLTIFPNGPWKMGKSMVQWVLFSLWVGIFAAYIGGHVVSAGGHYLEVFRIVGTVAFLGYAGSQPVNAIWKGQKISTTIKHSIDGLVYACLTAGVFGWLWPGA